MYAPYNINTRLIIIDRKCYKIWSSGMPIEYLSGTLYIYIYIYMVPLGTTQIYKYIHVHVYTSDENKIPFEMMTTEHDLLFLRIYTYYDVFFFLFSY